MTRNIDHSENYRYEGLSHVSRNGQDRMVNVADKAPTRRAALAPTSP